MDFSITQEEEAFRREFHDWFQTNVPQEFLMPEYRLPESWEERTQIYRDFQRKLFDAGYAGVTCPKKYGGAGGTFMENIIVTEALAPWLIRSGNINVVGHGMAGPLVLACGTEEQKEEFLPKLLNGEHIWCQGFSEPNAGSDLGNVSTRAIRDGDFYVVDGQKTWTTMAHVSDYCLLLARTNPELHKHKGLSYFVVDMRLPGIEVRPLLQITGETEFCEVYFDGVRVPKSRMVGEEGQGWRVTMTTLMYERVIGDIHMVSWFWWEYERIVEMARKIARNGRPASKDPIIRQKLAQCFVDLTVVRQIGYRSVSKMAKGEIPGPEGSISKLFWSEVGQRMIELATEIQGPYHQLMKDSLRAIDQGWWPHEYLYYRALTLAGGTSEIQRNIIGERVLGLPKDKARAIIGEGR
jgi:alkylation response protein AidB-like acyl-CoA dehydrogenase